MIERESEREVHNNIALSWQLAGGEGLGRTDKAPPTNMPSQ